MSKLSLCRLSAILLAVGLLTATMAAGQSSTNEQLPAGPMQERAAAACGSCHEARIIVQQRLSKAAWTKEIDKMIKWGAEVDPKDRDAMIDYFSANFGTEQAAYVAPKSAVETQSKKKSTP